MEYSWGGTSKQLLKLFNALQYEFGLSTWQQCQCVL